MEQKTSILHMRTPLSDPMAAIRLKPTARDSGLVDLAYAIDRYPEETKGLTFDQLGEFFRKKRGEMNRAAREARRLDAEADALRRNVESLRNFTMWGEANPVMQKPREPSFRRFRRAMLDCEVVQYGLECESREFDQEVMKFVEPFVIEHDWSAALSAGHDGDIRLPYEVCAFEFRLGDRPVIAIATQFAGDIVFSMAVEMDRWVFCGAAMSTSSGRSISSDGVSRVAWRVADQIRAVCIALDAEVAVSEAVRADHPGAGSGALRVPGRDYHVVSLAARHARPAPLGGDPTGRRVRVHFRRGHWRHFDNHKTWIRWMLVGDPDLGFIEKHYTL
jgi:hypothetical protein